MFSLNVYFSYKKNYFRKFVVFVFHLGLASHSTVEAVTIKCLYQETEVVKNGLLNQATDEPTIYSCFGTIWTTCDNSSVCMAVSNDHINGKTNDQVEYLAIKSATKLPEGIHKFFPNLIALGVGPGHLEEISYNDLRYPKLKALYLHHNRLTKIYFDVFKFTPELAYVSLNNNRLTNVAYDIFDKLTKLRTAFVDNNICISYQIHTNQPDTRREMRNRFYNYCKETQEMQDRRKNPQYDDSEDYADDELDHLSIVEKYRICRKYFMGKLDSRVSKPNE